MARPAPPACRVRLERRAPRARLWPVLPAPRARPAPWAYRVRLDRWARRARLWPAVLASVVLLVPPARKA